jgi:hypothetical protein
VQKRYKACLFICLTLVFLSGSICHAQKPLVFDLKLDNSKQRQAIPESGEFNLSLDSQLFVANLLVGDLEEYKLENFDADVEPQLPAESAADPIISEALSTPLPDIPAAEAQELALLSSTRPRERKFSSILTLTTDYYGHNLADENDEGLRIEKKLGKFKILGEFEQRRITKIPLPDDSNSPDFANQGQLRTSFLDNPGNYETEQHNKLTALASRYYLEATYSFKPTFSGRLAYKRSMIDTIEAEEKLELEGIVEANRNVLIKAGFNNETRPEVNEPRATKDSKVWTEFILKF